MNNNKGFLIAAITLFALLFSLFSFVAFSKSSLSVSARSAALYEPTTGSFIYGRNMNERLPMASTTKIMTALVAINNCADLSEPVTICEDAVGIEGSSAYFKGGESYTMLDLIHILLLRSANDAACQIAISISGSVENFAELMNDTAADLGLVDTCFTNPSGLDDKNHYTTAKDLALLTAAAMENDIFKSIVSRYKYTALDIENGERSIYVNHNKLLKSYDGCIGVKTGFTRKSGRCLVSAAERNGVTLIAVTLNAPDDWRDHTKMLDYGFSAVAKHSAIEKGDFSYKIPVVGAEESFIYAKNLDSFEFIGSSSGNVEIIPNIPSLLTAPVLQGEAIGSLTVKYNGRVIGSVDVVATTSAKKEKSFFDKLTQK